MLIFDEHNRSIILESIHTPITSDYMYVLDLDLKDFKLAPLLVLEEIVAPSLEIEICGFRFIVPATWAMLIGDEETSMVDLIAMSELAGMGFGAFVYGHSLSRPHLKDLIVTRYIKSHVNVVPALNKQQMLCHPISPDTWVNVTYSDSCYKYLKNCTIGEFI